MDALLKLHTAIAARWSELTDEDAVDRGDSPVSTAVIVMMIAAVAITVVGIIRAKAVGWANLIPDGP